MIQSIKPYPTYKDSGVVWLGDVPEHWEVSPNRALFVEVKERDHPEDQMLSVTITKGVIPQRALLADSSKKDRSNQDKSAYKVVRPGDIVYNKMRAWQGAVGVSDYQGIVSPAYVVQRPREGVDSRYFHHLLRTPAFAKEAERWSYGITSDMWSLRPEHFKMIYGCFPPLPEQAAIVSYLDHADRRIRRYIRAKQKLIKLLEEQKQSIIHRAVTRGLDPNVRLKRSGVASLGDVPEHWEVRRIRNIAEMRVSNIDKHTKDGEEPVRLCNYVDVYKNERITENLSFMRATALPAEIKRFHLESRDVLITKDSEVWNDIGVPGLVEYTAPDLVCGYHLAILRARRDQLEGEYLLRALQSPSVAYQFHVAANGVTRYGLSHGAIKSVLVPLPPLSEQVAIARDLDDKTASITATINRAQIEVDLLREYRTRLISDVVTGKLDVREAAARLPDKIAELDPLEEVKALVEGDEETEDAGLDAAPEEVET